MSTFLSKMYRKSLVTGDMLYHRLRNRKNMFLAVITVTYITVLTVTRRIFPVFIRYTKFIKILLNFDFFRVPGVET